MSKYPSVRYSVVDGELVDEVIHGPGEERPGWLPSPHTFRALSVAELAREGHPPDEAERLHQRELRRVAHIFAGRSPEEAERLADAPDAPGDGPNASSAALEEIWGMLCPDCGPGDSSGIVAAVKDLQDKLAAAEKTIADKDALIAEMTAKFDKNWKQLVAERDRLKAQLKAKGKPADAAEETAG